MITPVDVKKIAAKAWNDWCYGRTATKFRMEGAIEQAISEHSSLVADELQEIYNDIMSDEPKLKSMYSGESLERLIRILRPAREEKKE